MNIYKFHHGVWRTKDHVASILRQYFRSRALRKFLPFQLAISVNDTLLFYIKRKVGYV